MLNKSPPHNWGHLSPLIWISQALYELSRTFTFWTPVNLWPCTLKRDTNHPLSAHCVYISIPWCDLLIKAHECPVQSVHTTTCRACCPPIRGLSVVIWASVCCSVFVSSTTDPSMAAIPNTTPLLNLGEVISIQQRYHFKQCNLAVLRDHIILSENKIKACMKEQKRKSAHWWSHSVKG